MLTVRQANLDDLPAIIALLADDPLGSERERSEDPVPASYTAAFDAIEADPHQLLLVLDDDGAVAGTCQVTFIPGLSHQGAWRAQVEAVRVARELRGRGAGRFLMEWVIERARERSCAVVALTSDKSRVDAHRFYERLGFVDSHVGMKLRL